MTKTFELVASPSDVFSAFTDPGRVQVWSQGGRVENHEGGAIDLFGGMVSGKFEKIDQNSHIIIMKWRLKEWPSGM